MPKNTWRFLHCSNDNIFYYRRVIPKPLRGSFNNLWEIKKSLKTRDESLATLRHNQLNIKIERLITQAKTGENVSKDLSSLFEDLNAKKKFLAEFETSPRKSIWSGVIMFLRGKPLCDEKGEIVRPATITKDNNKLIDPDGNIISETEMNIALTIARQQLIKVMSPALESALNIQDSFFWFEFDAQGTFQSLTPFQKGRPQEVKEIYISETQAKINDGTLVSIPFIK